MLIFTFIPRFCLLTTVQSVPSLRPSHHRMSQLLWETKTHLDMATKQKVMYGNNTTGYSMGITLLGIVWE